MSAAASGGLPITESTSARKTPARPEARERERNVTPNAAHPSTIGDFSASDMRTGPAHRDPRHVRFHQNFAGHRQKERRRQLAAGHRRPGWVLRAFGLIRFDNIFGGWRGADPGGVPPSRRPPRSPP